MSFLSDILKKIKKPVDALKDFLTPKERVSVQEKEKSSPVQRVETKLPSFEYKPPSFEGLKSFASSFIPPKEAFNPVALAPRETPEERAARLAKAHETTKKIAEFGKAVLRAGPRAAASVTLEAQGRRTMIPETRAEKFLFGQEPLESLTERVERFPERAKEFGISEPVSKKIAPFAVLGLTALDILPPLPGKGVAKQTIKELAKKYGDDVAKQIIKKGGKELIEKALEVGGEAVVKKAGIAAQFVREFKYELPAHLMPAKGKPTWNIGKILWNTMRSGNVQGQDLARNKGAMSWVIDRLSGGNTELEPLLQKYAGARSTNKQYKKLYAVLKSKNYNIEDYKKVMSELKGIEPMVIEHKLAPAVSELKVAAQKTPAAALKEIAPGDFIEAGIPAKPFEELKKILYHGTDFENVPKIQKSGFKVGGFLAHGYPQGVYFTTTKKEAQNYGKVIQSTTKLKLSEFFDVSKHKELNGLSGNKYVQKLNQIIREAAESKGVEIPKPSAKQLKQYTDLIGELKDPLDISDIKTATLQKLDYKGFIAAEKGIGKEIVVFDPKDIIVGGKPSEILKAATQTKIEIPKTRLSALGFVEIEKPVAKAVETLASRGVDTVSSGFHSALNKKWTIVVKGEIDESLKGAAKRAGLEITEREAPKGTGQIFTDISLSKIKVDEAKKAESIFNRFAELTEAEKMKPTAELKEILKGKAIPEKLPGIPEIKGAKAIDLSQPAKAAQPSKVQEIISEYQKRINTTPAKKAATPIRKTLDDTYTAIIDRFHPITKLARKATELRPGENPELLARRYLGVQGIAESKLFWNTTRLTVEGNLEVTGPGLSKILRPAKNNIDDLRTLMIAERDIELSQRTLEGGKKVIGTTSKKSRQVINALKQKYGDGFAQLSKTAQGVREWSHKALLDPLLEVGAISKEQYNTITKSNKFYVPFQRVIEELETHGFVPKKANIFTPRSVPVKKLKGSTRDIIDPFESMITNAYKVTDFVERARVGRSISNLRNTSPELAEMIRPIKPKLVPVAKQGEELIFRPSFFTPDKNTMMVFENGKRKFYQVPEDVFKAVSGMMESDVGAIMKVLAFPARTLRAGATLTPEFMGRNPLRDQLTAFVFSKYGYVPGVDLAKGIFNTVGKTDLHGRWLAGGGAHSMLVSLDRMTSQATLAKVLGAKDIKGMVKNPLEALRILSEFGEKGTRVGAFGRAVKKGVSDLEAAFESRDITLDFARRGSQTRAVNMMVAFWNAQVQGLNKLVRAFRERPMQTTFKAASGITLPSVLLYLNNRNDPRYQELPQWQKDLFWILPIGDKGPIIRIPKPFEVGIIFGTVPEHILTWLDKNDPEALTSAAKTLMEASAPGYIPTGLQPIIENVANYSFFRQRQIVSEGKQALPKELQADRYTSETAKEVGKLIKQSPAKIENLFVSYTGGLGKYALDASDKLLKTLGVVSPPPEPAKTLADQPFLRAFVAREPIGSGSESVNKFYKLYDEANATKAAVKGLAEEGKETEAVNYLRSNPAGFYTKGLNKVARTFSDLRKKRDAVLDSRELNPEQKKRAVDALDRIMTEIARQTVELVKTSNEKLGQ